MYNSNSTKSNMIDRKNLVQRHNPSITKADKLSPLTVGNGEFAFTVDITGLQTYNEEYEKGIPLSTMSNWGWHKFKNPNGYSIENYPLTYYESQGRQIGYPFYPLSEGADPAANWLRNNPHRLNLGAIKLRIKDTTGETVSLDSFTNVQQTLDLWTGIIKSRYNVCGQNVIVHTYCHPGLDMIAVEIESPLLKSGQIEILFKFPYGSWKSYAADWKSDELHTTMLNMKSSNSAQFTRILNEEKYYVSSEWYSKAKIQKEADHTYILTPVECNGKFSMQCLFSSCISDTQIPSIKNTKNACELHWNGFWRTGGAIEVADSKDSRAFELECRIVLSQYLTALQCGGSLPPQESGLIHNSWAGKFHLEMHWWHAAHFTLWGRTHLLEKSLEWYFKILDKTRNMAATQGYKGARWPKCTAEEGINAPCYIEPFLIWQQPHPIFYAELIYRNKPSMDTLIKYKELVYETAEFMASYATWDDSTKRFVLGPPVAPAQEVYNHASTFNPTFELSYWFFALGIAQKWLQRLGMERNREWDNVLNNLSRLPVVNGMYVAAETAPDTFNNPNYIKDHPTMLAPLGMLPGINVDKEIMRKTLFKVMEVWNWETTWGWDYPMAAMTAARLGEADACIKILLMDTPKNIYLPNGNCYQHRGLPVYLPANGGLLYTTAMMAAGWDGGPEIHAPGYPQDGTWTVKFENISKAP